MDQDVNNEPVIPAEQTSQATMKKKSGGLKKLGIVLLIVFGGVAFFIGSALFSAKGAGEAATKIIDNLQAGECQLIYDTQVADGFREVTSNEVWNEGCQRISAILVGEAEKQSGINVSTGTGETTTSEVDFVIRGNDGETYDVKLTMAKEGEWKMFSMDSVAQGEASNES